MIKTEQRSDAAPEPGSKHLFAVVNTMAGGYHEERFRRGIAMLRKHGWDCQEGRITQNTNVFDLVRLAIADGCDVVAAAGGDGTISAVANALAGTEVPMLIVPCGTGNAVARELGLPLGIERALALITTGYQIRHMDAMEVNGHHYVLVVSIGLTPMVMQGTRPEHKRRYGRLAYLAQMIRRLVGLQPARFRILIDGQAHLVPAAEIVITNVSQVGTTPVRWGPDVRVDDGRIEVCPVYARTLGDLIGVAWELLFGKRRGPRVHRLDAHRQVRITTSKELLVEGDGDLIGTTPLDLHVVPGAVPVIVPKPGLLGANMPFSEIINEFPISQRLFEVQTDIQGYLVPELKQQAQQAQTGGSPHVGQDTVHIKPHHFADIIQYYGADSLRLTPHPYGHAYHLVAQHVLNDRDLWLAVELGADDICAPCAHNLEGVCDDVLDTEGRPQVPRLKRDYNLLLDQRWCARLDLSPGDHLTAKDFCRRLLALEGDIRDIYAEMPEAFAQERLRNLRVGAARYLAGN